MVEHMARECLVCKEIVRGRADKKFCSTECRVDFNNKYNRDRNNYMRNVNNTLRKNRRILEELNPRGKAKIHKKVLLEKGFKFTYFTSLYRTKAGKEYFYCYEQGLTELDNGYYALVEKQDYIE